MTEPFKAGHWSLETGDEIEFIGQMESRRGEVLIGVGSSGQFAVWASANDVATKSKGVGKYLPSYTVTIEGKPNEA